MGKRKKKKNHQTILTNKDNCNPSHPSTPTSAHGFHSSNKKQKPELQVTENTSETPEKQTTSSSAPRAVFTVGHLPKTMPWKWCCGTLLGWSSLSESELMGSGLLHLQEFAVKQTWAAEPGRSEPASLTEASRLLLGWTISQKCSCC